MRNSICIIDFGQGQCRDLEKGKKTIRVCNPNRPGKSLSMESTSHGKRVGYHLAGLPSGAWGCVCTQGMLVISMANAASCASFPAPFPSAASEAAHSWAADLHTPPVREIDGFFFPVAPRAITSTRKTDSQSSSVASRKDASMKQTPSASGNLFDRSTPISKSWHGFLRWLWRRQHLPCWRERFFFVFVLQTGEVSWQGEFTCSNKEGEATS